MAGPPPNAAGRQRGAGWPRGWPRGRRARPARPGAGPYVAGGGPGGRPWRPAGWPRGGRGQPARDSKRFEAEAVAAAAWRLRPCSDRMQPPTPGTRASACADPSSVGPARRQPSWASCRLHRHILLRAPPERLLPPSAPRRRAPSACGACRRRWLGRGRRACSSRSATCPCPAPRTTLPWPPRRRRRSRLTSPPGGRTASWPRARVVLLRRLPSAAPAAVPAPAAAPAPAHRSRGRSAARSARSAPFATR